MRRPQPALLSSAAAVLATAGLALAPSVASAATTISKVGSIITVTGDDAASTLETSAFKTVMQLEDSAGGVVDAGTGCTQDGPNAVVCFAFEVGDSIVANLGGGVDKYKYESIDVPQKVDGGPGNDVIFTGKGNDTLIGGTGHDDLTGGSGDDLVDGGTGRDLLVGDGGTPERVDEETGVAPPAAPPGKDKILARDGEVDTVNCGGGADTAEVDSADVVSECASVDRPAQNVPGTTPATTPGGTPGSTPGTTPGANPPSASSDLTLAGGVTTLQTPRALSKGKKITLTLTANGTCTGAIAIAIGKSEAKRLKLGKKELTLGTSKAITFKAGAPTEIGVAVDRKYRAKLAKASKLKASLAIVCTDAADRSYLGGTELRLKK